MITEQQAIDFIYGFLFIAGFVLIMIMIAHFDSKRLANLYINAVVKQAKEKGIGGLQNPEIAEMNPDEVRIMLNFYKVNQSLDDVPGNVLPPIGATVQIYLHSKMDWFDHTVVGYYATITAVRTYKIFVQSICGDGHLNKSELCDIVWSRS